MKHLLFWVLVLTVAACSSSSDSPVPTNQNPTSGTLRRWIVILEPNQTTTDDIAVELAGRYGGSKGHIFTHGMKGFVLKLPAKASAQEEQSRRFEIEQDSRIRYVTEDIEVHAFAQTLPTGINRINTDRNALAAINNDGGNIDGDIAILDTGIDLDHPDLNVFRSVDFTGSGSANDGHGHGTHVAGIAAALDNTQGVVGVAPGARLWAIKVLDNNGSGFLSDIIAGVQYVSQHASEIEVANLSLGGPGSDDNNCGLTNQDPLHEAICSAVSQGVVFTVAAGNESQNASQTFPASYDEVITVSAVADSDGIPGGVGPATSAGKDDTLASYSNFGSDVDIAAPGTDILSTFNNGGTRVFSGTSMAAPHVAGAALLYIVANAKPTTRNGVRALTDGLISLSFPQSSPEGFSGDRDTTVEPLLNVEGIGPSNPTLPSLTVDLNSDRSTYDLSLGQSTAVLSISVRNELANVVSGLNAAQFTTFLDGQVFTLIFSEIGTSGTYQAFLDVSSLSIGTHQVMVSVTDSRNTTASDQITFSVASTSLPTIPPTPEPDPAFPPPTPSPQPSPSPSPAPAPAPGTSIHVAVIFYELFFPAILQPQIYIHDDNQQWTAGAFVMADLYFNGSYFQTFFGVTDVYGRASYNLFGAPYGCYQTVVWSVTKPGSVWDYSQDSFDYGVCF